jgi:hypothetical protein
MLRGGGGTTLLLDLELLIRAIPKQSFNTWREYICSLCAFKTELLLRFCFHYLFSTNEERRN